MSIAFFDIDGTLLPKPSLERRFFRELSRHGKIPAKNYFAWLAEAIRLAPYGLFAMAYRNKMYLRGIPTNIFSISGETHQAACLPEFYPAALQRVWWHALRGDSIVLLSGTLQPLAAIVKFGLERELLWRGVESKVTVVATQLDACNGRWTGRICGEAMFGEAKARAAKTLSAARNVSLTQCSAYGDSSLDRWMLSAVGHPFAINPTSRLSRVAALHGWPVLDWSHSAIRTASEQRPLRGRMNEKGALLR